MTPLHYAMRGENAEAAIALLEAVKSFRGDHPDFQELIQMLENYADE